MKKPVNFETITHEYYKFLGINWQIRIEGTANCGSDDFNRVWFIPDNVGETQIGRTFYFDIFWDKNRCEVFVPLIGDGDVGPHIKDYKIESASFKTPDDFKTFLTSMVEDLMNDWKLNDDAGLTAGHTTLSFLVKSDSSDIHHSVDYLKKTWSCTCKAFIYSKQLPQTCKHIDKIKK